VIEAPTSSTRGSFVPFASGIQMLHHSIASREIFGSSAEAVAASDANTAARARTR